MVIHPLAQKINKPKWPHSRYDGMRKYDEGSRVFSMCEDFFDQRPAASSSKSFFSILALFGLHMCGRENHEKKKKTGPYAGQKRSREYSDDECVFVSQRRCASLDRHNMIPF